MTGKAIGQAPPTRERENPYDLRDRQQSRPALDEQGSREDVDLASSNYLNDHDNHERTETIDGINSKADGLMTGDRRFVESPSHNPRYTTEFLKRMMPKLKEAGFSRETQDAFEAKTEQFGLSRPGTSWEYTTENVEVNDIIFYRHAEFCKDLREIASGKYDYRIVPGGFEILKNRRAVVVRKCNELVLVCNLTTFSNTSKETKLRQTVRNPVTGKKEPFLASFVHFESASHPGESEDWPGCWDGDARVRYVDKRGFDLGTKKDSFADINVQYPVLSGTAFQIKGKVQDRQSRATLNAAVAASYTQATTEREIATNLAVDDDPAQAYQPGRSAVDSYRPAAMQGQTSSSRGDYNDEMRPPARKRPRIDRTPTALDAPRSPDPCVPSEVLQNHRAERERNAKAEEQRNSKLSRTELSKFKIDSSKYSAFR